MIKIGLLGGMSWQSTAEYYRQLNREVQLRAGGLHSAEILLDSVDFAEVEALQRAARWDSLGRLLAHRAVALQQAGAGCLAICSNTTHRVADRIAEALTVPVVHVVDAVGAELARVGARRPILLATDFTLRARVYEDRLGPNGVEVTHAPPAEQAWLHRVIYDELCAGTFAAPSRERLRSIIAAAQSQGADAAILGCTELGLLLGTEATGIPAIDSMSAHVRSILELALVARTPEAA